MAALDGAVFDCDGTLLDSMPMWSSAFAVLCARYGVVATPELMAEVEPITLGQSCALLHERYGMGEGAEALLVELEAWVADQYARNVVELPGVRDFLDSLKDAGISMVVATSTTSRLVRDALAAHDMGGYFSDVICTAEVRDGRDKEFPDVYLEALSRLGTPIEGTWVFEDAPFGVRSARRAGFHVAAVHNDHDGRPVDFLRAWADIFSECYESISLGVIRGFDDKSRRAVPEA